MDFVDGVALFQWLMTSSSLQLEIHLDFFLGFGNNSCLHQILVELL